MGYIVAADSMRLSFFSNFRDELRKTHHLCSRVRYGRSRSSKVVDSGTDRNGILDFLLVSNSNLGLISHRFWDTATYWVKSQIFPTPLFFTALGRDDRIRISRKALRILAVESFADLIVKFRDPSLRRPGRTAGCDRQTDAIAKTGQHAAMLTPGKNCVRYLYISHYNQRRSQEFDLGGYKWVNETKQPHKIFLR